MELTLQTADQLTSIATSIVTMQVLKRIDQTDKTFLLMLRSMYGVAVLTNFLILFLIKKAISKRKDARKIKVKKEPKFNLFKSQEEGNESDEDTETEVEITFEEYDMKEVRKLINSTLMQSTLLTLAHYKWGSCQPLVLQILSPIKSLFFSPLVRSYIFDREIIRPFEKNMLFSAKKEEEVNVVEKKKKKED